MSIQAVTVPKWGIEMQEGTITEWRLQAGATVGKGDELVDIETDKIVNTLEAPASGVLQRVVAEAGDTLKVGQLRGVIADAGESSDAIDAFIADFKPVDASFAEGDTGTEAEAPQSSSDASDDAGGEVRISPVARRLAERLGVDVSTIKGTGRNGRISKQDVEAAAAAGEQPADGDRFETIPLTSRRQTIARRLETTTAIPTFDLAREMWIDGPSGFTGRLLSAVAKALIDVPAVNVQVFEDRLQQYRHADINVAVDTPEGLVAPLLAGVEGQSVDEIKSSLGGLAERARENRLTAEEIQPGSFTVSNLGAFGVDGFRAVINPPQGAILAIGRVREGRFQATLSCDHRAIDGADGARFLEALQKHLDG